MITKQQFWRWFWISFLVFSLGYVWYCFYVPADKVAWMTDENAARVTSRSTGKPLLIFITAKWCVPCRIMKRTVLTDPEVLRTIETKYTPLLVDFDDPRFADLIARYQIRGTPVTLILNAEGILTRVADGGVAKAEFLKFLSQ